MKILNLFAIFFISFLSTNCMLKRISKNEAVARAENFVLEHGYSSKLADLETTHIVFDVEENYDTKGEAIKDRLGELEPDAIYVNKQGLGWIVAFKHGPKYEKHKENIRLETDSTFITRVVRVNRSGKKVWIQHQAYIANKNDSLLKP